MDRRHCSAVTALADCSGLGDRPVTGPSHVLVEARNVMARMSLSRIRAAHEHAAALARKQMPGVSGICQGSALQAIWRAPEAWEATRRLSARCLPIGWEGEGLGRGRAGRRDLVDNRG